MMANPIEKMAMLDHDFAIWKKQKDIHIFSAQESILDYVISTVSILTR